jgi:adenosine deaminase
MKPTDDREQLLMPFGAPRDKLIALPKVDLHRHLTGSVRTETVIDLAIKNKIPLPTYDKTDLEKYITITTPAKNYKEFIKPLTKIINSVICKAEDFYRLTYEAAQDAHKDNVRYLELRTSPSGLTGNKNFSLYDTLESISRGIQDAKTDFNIITKLILSVPRHILGWKILSGAKGSYNKYFNDVLQAALDYKDKCVVGFDLTGQYENKYPPRLFEEFFKKAKSCGFKITIHAGETGGPDRIEEAIDFLHADRIGHGIFSDERVLSILRDRAIPLEICLICNIMSGCIRSWFDHPIQKIYDSGVVITVNTDDPRYLRSTLTDEYENLINRMQFSIEDIKKIILNGINAAFLPQTEKESIVKSFERDLGHKER